MRIYVDGALCDPAEKPIGIYLSRAERKQIADMDPNAFGIYAQLPDRMSLSQKEQFVAEMRVAIEAELGAAGGV